MPAFISTIFKALFISKLFYLCISPIVFVFFQLFEEILLFFFFPSRTYKVRGNKLQQMELVKVVCILFITSAVIVCNIASFISVINRWVRRYGLWDILCKCRKILFLWSWGSNYLDCSFTNQIIGCVGCCSVGRFQALYTPSTSWAFLLLSLHWSRSPRTVGLVMKT